MEAGPGASRTPSLLQWAGPDDLIQGPKEGDNLKERQRALGSCLGREKQSPFCSRLLRIHTPASLLPSVQSSSSDPHPPPTSEDSRVRDGPGGGRAGVGRHTPKTASSRQPPQTMCFPSVLAPVLSCPVAAAPPPLRLAVFPGPQGPEHPVCWPQPLRGLLKDPWRGRSTRLPTEGDPGGSWQSVSPLRLLRTSLHCV